MKNIRVANPKRWQRPFIMRKCTVLNQTVNHVFFLVLASLDMSEHVHLSSSKFKFKETDEEGVFRVNSNKRNSGEKVDLIDRLDLICLPRAPKSRPAGGLGDGQRREGCRARGKRPRLGPRREVLLIGIVICYKRCICIYIYIYLHINM